MAVEAAVKDDGDGSREHQGPGLRQIWMMVVTAAATVSGVAPADDGTTVQR
jgi:hypothetical protein